MKTIIIILLLTISGCYDDTPDPDYPIITTLYTTPPAETESCQHGKMSCIDNRSVLCFDGEWILVDDCESVGAVCHFNEPEFSWGIPFFAVCVAEDTQ